MSYRVPPWVLPRSWIHLGTCWVWKLMLEYRYCLNFSGYCFSYPICLFVLIGLIKRVMFYRCGYRNFIGVYRYYLSILRPTISFKVLFKHWKNQVIMKNFLSTIQIMLFIRPEYWNLLIYTTQPWSFKWLLESYLPY